MRGENGKRRTIEIIDDGSSPHARGKHDQDFQNLRSWGLIPACAGKTSMDSLPLVLSTGSSPHARGKLLQRGAIGVMGGLIPACAGKTALSTWARLVLPAHPRMRGENASLFLKKNDHQGSSPHARGKPVGATNLGLCGGLIPACAGKTARNWGVFTPGGAHPRMRGENPSSD